MTSKADYSQWRPHPWHGVKVGPNPPEVVNAYIELTPTDSVKYEIDKETGYLRVDRPQRYSSQPPALYGFVPRTYCAEHVNDLSPKSDRGDGDPLDICVLSERQIARSEIILNAQVIGGLRMIDNGEADDKIIAVLENDDVWGSVKDLSDLPRVLRERLRHYFLTYKSVPELESKEGTGEEEVDLVYGYDHAAKVIEASMQDYEEEFGT
jgi:inorganic pyrophosphatase